METSTQLKLSTGAFASEKYSINHQTMRRKGINRSSRRFKIVCPVVQLYPTQNLLLLSYVNLLNVYLSFVFKGNNSSIARIPFVQCVAFSILLTHHCCIHPDLDGFLLSFPYPGSSTYSYHLPPYYSLKGPNLIPFFSFFFHSYLV